ncbi:hypothetical protein PanWU01x14_260310, partial [Parasponia andersonii]
NSHSSVHIEEKLKKLTRIPKHCLSVCTTSLLLLLKKSPFTAHVFTYSLLSLLIPLLLALTKFTVYVFFCITEKQASPLIHSLTHPDLTQTSLNYSFGTGR